LILQTDAFLHQICPLPQPPQAIALTNVDDTSPLSRKALPDLLGIAEAPPNLYQDVPLHSFI
jgi:hypothetical protein